MNYIKKRRGDEGNHTTFLKKGSYSDKREKGGTPVSTYFVTVHQGASISAKTNFTHTQMVWILDIEVNWKKLRRIKEQGNLIISHEEM